MIYFISDAHLGSRLVQNPHEHEMRLVRWLDKVKIDAEIIFLMGDMFDFWFEYKTVVPKGFVRFLGKLAELSDSGVEIHFFAGNHDLWTFGYLRDEVGLIVHTSPEEMEIKGKKFFLAHGDGLYTEESGFKIIRKIFHSRIAQKLFRLLPPQIGQNFGYAWSKSNRKKILHLENKYEGEENEFLVKYAKKYTAIHQVDYLVFGHRHIELNLQITPKATVIILGDFVGIFSYGVFDGKNFFLENF